MTRLQTRPFMTGGRRVRRAWSLVSQLAEVLVARDVLTAILERSAGFGCTRLACFESAGI